SSLAAKRQAKPAPRASISVLPFACAVHPTATGAGSAFHWNNETIAPSLIVRARRRYGVGTVPLPGTISHAIGLSSLPNSTAQVASPESNVAVSVPTSAERKIHGPDILPGAASGLKSGAMCQNCSNSAGADVLACN